MPNTPTITPLPDLWTETKPTHIRTQVLQEIVARATTAGRHMSLIIRHGRKDAEPGIELLVYSHDRRDVAAPIAVVWRGPDSDDGFLWEVELTAALELKKFFGA